MSSITVNSSVRNFSDVDSERMKKASPATTTAVSSSTTRPADADVSAALTPATSSMMIPATARADEASRRVRPDAS